jgi:hypothetical protein
MYDKGTFEELKLFDKDIVVGLVGLWCLMPF